MIISDKGRQKKELIENALSDALYLLTFGVVETQNLPRALEYEYVHDIVLNNSRMPQAKSQNSYQLMIHVEDLEIERGSPSPFRLIPLGSYFVRNMDGSERGEKNSFFLSLFKLSHELHI